MKQDDSICRGHFLARLTNTVAGHLAVTIGDSMRPYVPVFIRAMRLALLRAKGPDLETTSAVCEYVGRFAMALRASFAKYVRWFICCPALLRLSRTTDVFLSCVSELVDHFFPVVLWSAHAFVQ